MLGIFTIGIIPSFTLGCINFIRITEKEKPEGYELPRLSNLRLAVVFAFLFALLEVLFCKGFTTYFVRICREQKNTKERELRSQKAAINLYKMIYHQCIVIWGYILIKDKDYMPFSLGGKGDFNQSFVGFPYQQHSPYLKEYFEITTGFHLAGLIMHFYKVRKNDFIEMALHHVIAIFLCIGAYLLNLWETAILICFVHDIAEVICNFVKMVAETHYHNVSAIMFLYLMMTWFYTRVYVFSQFIFKIWSHVGSPTLDFKSPLVWPYMCFLLTCLLILQCYWFLLFCKLAIRFIR